MHYDLSNMYVGASLQYTKYALNISIQNCYYLEMGRSTHFTESTHSPLFNQRSRLRLSTLLTTAEQKKDGVAGHFDSSTLQLLKANSLILFSLEVEVRDQSIDLVNLNRFYERK